MKVDVLTRAIEARVSLTGKELVDLESEFWGMVGSVRIQLPMIVKLLEGLLGHPDD